MRRGTRRRRRRVASILHDHISLRDQRRRDESKSCSPFFWFLIFCKECKNLFRGDNNLNVQCGLAGNHERSSSIYITPQIIIYPYCQMMSLAAIRPDDIVENNVGACSEERGVMCLHWIIIGTGKIILCWYYIANTTEHIEQKPDPLNNGTDPISWLKGGWISRGFVSSFENIYIWLYARIILTFGSNYLRNLGCDRSARDVRGSTKLTCKHLAEVHWDDGSHMIVGIS